MTACDTFFNRAVNYHAGERIAHPLVAIVLVRQCRKAILSQQPRTTMGSIRDTYLIPFLSAALWREEFESVASVKSNAVDARRVVGMIRHVQQWRHDKVVAMRCIPQVLVYTA